MQLKARSQGTALLVVILASTFMTAMSHGGAVVFFSPSTATDGTATLDNPSLDIKLGDTVDLGVWVGTSAASTQPHPDFDPGTFDILGLGLDLVSGSSNFLTANSHQIQEGDDDTGTTRRWISPQTFSNGTLNDSATELVTGSNTASLDGIEQPPIDPTFGLSADPTHRNNDDDFDSAVTINGAFLHSILSLQPSGVGTTELFFQVGDTKIAYLPADDLTITFGAGASQDVDRTISGPQADNSIADATVRTWFRGDVDKDGDTTVMDLDPDDIDAVFDRFDSPPGSASADRLDLANFDNDMDIDDEDTRIWVENIKGTFFGDTNLDGVVDIVDFGGLAGGFGSLVGWAGGNFNGDDVTDILDFGIQAGNFGAGLGPEWAGPAHLPEPASLGLLLGLGLLGLTRHPSRNPSGNPSGGKNGKFLFKIASKVLDRRARKN